MLKAHTRYSNQHMQTADLYVTKVTETEVIGFWVHKKLDAMMGNIVDRLKIDRIKPSDWTEVADGF